MPSAQVALPADPDPAWLKRAQAAANRVSSSSLDVTPPPHHPHHHHHHHHHLSLRRSPSASTRDCVHDAKSPAARPSRKPSPGLTARFQALGFGKDSSQKQKLTAPSSHDPVGRIPEGHIRSLDLLHRSNSTKSVIERRGRAWSGATGRSAPRIIGDGPTGFTVAGATPELPLLDSQTLAFRGGDNRPPEICTRSTPAPADAEESAMNINNEAVVMDSQKYRLPDHDNGNGTKATAETRTAHLERSDDPPPPPPIAKDSPIGGDAPGSVSNDVQSYFNPFGLQRSGSVYSLSRVSFASQLAQLTSLQLPDAESLSSRVSAIPTSQSAAAALTGAAEQIKSWISKASEVLEGLDADDDVEWAAAGGREGLEDVDNAIARFEELINVYVSAIEELQGRKDIANVGSHDLKRVVSQVETIIADWENIRRTLTGVKTQVGIAIEWEELWNTVLGDIGNEMDILGRLVFEMEEKRHRSLAIVEAGEGLDIGDLETIVEETPTVTHLAARNRFSVTASFPLSPQSPNTPSMAQDDASLLALFARMQPLRASLDFLPMRLSTFHARADDIFPTACEELETRRQGLEGSWKRLEKDAESLRRELGEDRWVLVFRGAGRQALKMYESVERSLVKLKEAIESGAHLNNPSALGKKIESYENKKMHYGPAIERVLAIIERGVHDRLTVNGEIVRLHADMQGKWEALKNQMHALDASLELLQADKRNQQLRDSISSLMSNDRSTVGSANDTPGSSPASSIIMSNLQGGTDPTTPARNGKHRPNLSHLPQPTAKRGAAPTPAGSSSQIPRKASATRLSNYGTPGAASSSPASRGESATPTGNRLPRPTLTSDGRPRWNSSVKTDERTSGHGALFSTPSPRANIAQSSAYSSRSFSASHSASRESRLPLRASVSDITTPSTSDFTPSRSRDSSQLPIRDRPSFNPMTSQLPMSSPSIRPQQLKSQASTSNLTSSRPMSIQVLNSGGMSSFARPAMSTRPASSLATNRRTSFLPQPRGRPDSSVTGRESPQAVAGAASAMRRNGSNTSTGSKGKDRPRWR